MKNIIFGGTFDPPHIGHLHLADTVWRMFNQPRFIFLPSGIPPHKDNSGITSREQRIAMLKAALEDTPWEIDFSEVERDGTTYTIDTLRDMKKRYGWSEPPGFLLGNDLSAGFSLWKEADALAREAVLLLAFREDASGGEVDFAYPHEKLGNSLLPVSSSEIRQKAAAGQGFRYLVPFKVYNYICNNGLYDCRC